MMGEDLNIPYPEELPLAVTARSREATVPAIDLALLRYQSHRKDAEACFFCGSKELVEGDYCRACWEQFVNC